MLKRSNIQQVNPDAIFAHIDSPAEGKVQASRALYVSGWACAHAGVEAIELYLDGQHVKSIHPNIQRPDVVKHLPDVSSASTSGFAAVIPIRTLPYGAHELDIAIVDRAGNARTFRRPFHQAERPRTDKDGLTKINRVGVNLIGYIKAEMGVGEATRGEAAAMSEAGVPFVILDYSHGNPARMSDSTWVHKVSKRPEYDVNLLHVNADVAPQVFSRLSPEVFANRHTIGYWAWEMPEFPDDWLLSFSLVDEVWVPSSYVQDSVSRKSPLPVVRIPHAIRTPPGPFLSRAEFGLPSSAYQFLMMYDVYSVRERKNPDGAIRAFKESFLPDDLSVSLVIKINNADEGEASVVSEWVGDHRNIHILDKSLSRSELDSLQARTDCFVSLHRSEGFGLPIAEAMSLGKPVIVTPWSGNADFTRNQNSACVDYRLVTLERDYGPYRAGQYWAEPDLAHASSWMKRLKNDPELGKSLGTAAARTISTEFSPLRVGQMISQRLKYLSPSST